MTTIDQSPLADSGDGRRNSDGSKDEKAEHIESSHDVGYIEKIDAAANIENIATSIDNLPISWFVWLVAATASTAGMLFGYDTGIISAVLVYLGDDLNNRPVTSNEKELITSLCSGGAFIGAIFAGNTADRVCLRIRLSLYCHVPLTNRNQFGRKMSIYLGCILFIVGAVLQAASYTIAQMSVGRLVVGFGVGSAAMVVPLYVAEVRPPPSSNSPFPPIMSDLVR